MINIRYCRRCDAPFDIGNSDICPDCRDENFEVQEELE